jgi:hypothetical protein
MLPLYLGLVVYQLEPGLLEGDTQQALLALVAARAPHWLQVMFYGALISAIFGLISSPLLSDSAILFTSCSYIATARSFGSIFSRIPFM